MITRRKCKCGRPVERITTFHSLGGRGRRKKGEKYHDEGVCEYCYMLFSHGLQGMKCDSCCLVFYIPLDAYYDENISPDKFVCPYCGVEHPQEVGGERSG